MSKVFGHVFGYEYPPSITGAAIDKMFPDSVNEDARDFCELCGESLKCERVENLCWKCAETIGAVKLESENR